ncbi:hypothetical protein [Rhodococcus sp. JS3073]|nr:hypothetical protein [Rhodococcus sp. JS3073]WAM20090.1 hypothetical protein OYT95_41705 [Rhodococcus sp. JS3073]
MRAAYFAITTLPFTRQVSSMPPLAGVTVPVTLEKIEYLATATELDVS